MRDRPLAPLLAPSLAEARLPRDAGARAVVLRARDAVAAGERPADTHFDDLLPAALKAHAARHFTPVADALRVGAWLDDLGVGSILDVGSGAGKLCVVAAIAAPRCRFLGIEQRSGLVEVARSIAARFELDDRVSFVEGSIGVAGLPAVEAYYLFNPFGENLLPSGERLDEDVELGDDRYDRDVREAEALLESAPPGTVLITHNGFGGRVPAAFEQLAFAPCAAGALVLRRRRRRPV